MFDRDVVDLSLRRVMELHQRAVSREQMCRFGGYMAEIFAACGLNLNTSATEETPRRFLQALFEATEGYDGEPKLLKVFDTECRGNTECRLGQVIEGPSPFSRCVSTMPCPFSGMPKSAISRINPSSASPTTPSGERSRASNAQGAICFCDTHPQRRRQPYDQSIT